MIQQAQTQQIKPLHLKILVVKLSERRLTKGGIHIPITVDLELHYGYVLAVSDNVKDIKAGNLILFGTYAGTDLTEYIKVSEDDITTIHKVVDAYGLDLLYSNEDSEIAIMNTIDVKAIIGTKGKVAKIVWEDI